MQEALQNGNSLIIFPEGTRSRTGETSKFKSGLYHLADTRTQTPFIPVYLENLFRILPKGERFPLPLVGTLYFGDPIYLKDGESKIDFLARTRKALIELTPNHTKT